jgi:PHD/YefM family antitoxin component YafN of YafNO toxin-antitoxin module
MRVSVKELLRNFSRLSDKALSEPVIITKNGRDRLVLLGMDEYSMLRDMPSGESPPDDNAADLEADVAGSVSESKPKRA